MIEADIDPEFVGLFRAAMINYDYGPDLSSLAPMSDWLEERGQYEAAAPLRMGGYPQHASAIFLISLGFEFSNAVEIVRRWALEATHA